MSEQYSAVHLNVDSHEIPILYQKSLIEYLENSTKWKTFIPIVLWVLLMFVKFKIAMCSCDSRTKTWKV